MVQVTENAQKKGGTDLMIKRMSNRLMLLKMLNSRNGNQIQKKIQCDMLTLIHYPKDPNYIHWMTTIIEYNQVPFKAIMSTTV
jgi:hypothetical protein